MIRLRVSSEITVVARRLLSFLAQSPLLLGRAEVRTTAYIAITADRGLCGGYNANVLRMAAVLDTDSQRRPIDVHLADDGRAAQLVDQEEARVTLELFREIAEA